MSSSSTISLTMPKDPNPFQELDKSEVKAFFYFIVALSWNDIVTNGAQLGVAQQAEAIKIKYVEWTALYYPIVLNKISVALLLQ